MRRLIYLLLILALLLGVIVLPDWSEDPRRLAIGEWMEQSSHLRAEVTEDTIAWRGFNRRGNLTYTWLQTNKEPYRVAIRRGEQLIEADVTFDGDDVALLEPDVFDKLPPTARRYIRERNHARQAPEEEIRLIFRRVKEKKS